MKENFSKKEVMQKIIPVIEGVASKLELVALEVDFVKDSGRWFLRIFLYNDKASITHQDCENVTRELDNYLDELIPVNYYMEVSSPGLDRKLKSSKEFAIFKGKKVKIKLKKPLEEGNIKKFPARIIDFSEEQGVTFLMLELNRQITLKEDEISSVKLVFDDNEEII